MAYYYHLKEEDLNTITHLLRSGHWGSVYLFPHVTVVLRSDWSVLEADNHVTVVLRSDWSVLEADNRYH